METFSVTKVSILFYDHWYQFQGVSKGFHRPVMQGDGIDYLYLHKCRV